MYLDYWGLREKPFANGRNPKAYIPSSTHEEALARLHYLVDSQRRLGLLLGAPGSGKSFMLSVLAQQLRRAAVRAAAFSLQGLSAHEMLWSLAAACGLHPDQGAGAFELWRLVGDLLAANNCQGIANVVLLDDADSASADVLGQVVRLVRGELSSSSRLIVVLAGRSNRMLALGSQLLELAELRVDLAAWELADTESYLQSCLLRAGRKESAFLPEALLRLHELSGGSVRRVALLADLALLAAAGGRLPLVDAYTVEAVYDELGVMDALVAAGDRP
jgi:type II secretory pathway predicted ATPase ExeA